MNIVCSETVLQSFFGFGSAVDIDIVLDGQETRKTAEIKGEDGKLETHYLYFDGESISGKVCVFKQLHTGNYGRIFARFHISLAFACHYHHYYYSYYCYYP
jgi:Vacuolar protein sorting-associated protein 26